MTNIIYLQVALLAFLIVLIFFKEKGIKLYNPVILVSIIYFVSFGMPNIIMLNDPSGFWEMMLPNNDILVKGLYFVILVYIFFLIGFYSPYYNKHIKRLVSNLFKNIPNINNYTLNIRNLPLVLIFLFVVGWISRVILILNGNYYHIEVGYNPIKPPEGFLLISHYLGIGSLFPIIGLSICFFEWLKKQNQKKYLIISILLLLLELVYALPSGSKERVLLPIAILLFLWSLKGGLPLAPVIFFSSIFIFFIFPFIGLYRSLFLTGDMFIDFQRAFDLYIDLFRGFNLEKLNLILTPMFAERLNYSIIVAKIVEDTPHIWDFKLGYSYLMFFIAIIPRIIWHNKPAVSIFANDFGRDYGFISPVDYMTSIDMTWVGEMFINFGWYGILCGFFYGLFYQIIYSYFLKNGKISVLSAFFYSIGLYYMVRGGMFTIQFVGVVKIYLVILFLLFPFIKKIELKK